MGFPIAGPALYPYCNLPDVHTAGKLCCTECIVSMFVSGTLEILFAVTNKKNISSWGWYLASGIIDLILGIYLMANIGLSMAVLPFIVAFWLMFRGFASTGYAMDLKRYGTRNWGWYMAFGILAILCSIGIIWQPGLGALSLVYMIAYTLLIIGIFRVMLSFELKSLHKRNKEYYGEQDTQEAY